MAILFKIYPINHCGTGISGRKPGITAASRLGDYCYHSIADFANPALLPASIWFYPKTEADSLRFFAEACFLQKMAARVMSVIWEV